MEEDCVLESRLIVAVVEFTDVILRAELLRLARDRNPGIILTVALVDGGEKARTIIPSPQPYFVARRLQIQDTKTASVINTDICCLDLGVAFEAFTISARGYEFMVIMQCL